MRKEYLTNKTDFDVHVGNRNNPHGVTAAQTGAVPIYEYGNHYYNDDNIDNWKTCGIYSCTNTTRNTPYEVGDSAWGTVLIFSTVFNRIVQLFNGWNANHEIYYIRSYNYETWDPWKKLATDIDLANYLPLKGGVLETLELFINFGLGSIYADNNAAALRSRNAASNNDGRAIFIANDVYETLPNALFIRDFLSNEVYTDYNIFGQHNTALLANTIESMMQTGEVRTLDEATKATLSSIEQTIQKNYGEAQQEGVDAITLELLERGIL